MIRSHLGDREDQFFATVFLGSGLLFVAMLFGAAAAASAPLASVKFQGAPLPSPDAIGFARALAYTLLYVYGVRVAAVFMIAVSTIALRTASLPRWLVFVGYVIAVDHAAQRLVLQARRAALPALGGGGQPRDPVSRARAADAGGSRDASRACIDGRITRGRD